MFLHYCLSPLAGSINKHPSSLSVYLTCSINHPPLHQVFFFFHASLCSWSSVPLYRYSPSPRSLQWCLRQRWKSHHVADRQPAFICDNGRKISWTSCAALIWKESSEFWETHLCASFDEATDNKGEVHDAPKHVSIGRGKSSMENPTLMWFQKG